MDETQQPKISNHILLNPITKYFTVLLFASFNALISLSIYILVGSLLGGGIALIVQPITFAYIELPVLGIPFLVVELFLVSYLFLLIIKRTWTISFYKIFLIFILVQYLYLAIPNFISQTKIDQKNPVSAGVQQYDFTKDVLINGRNSSKKSISIEGNKIIWLEKIEEENATYKPEQIYLFQFDDRTSKGETVEISGNKSNDSFKINNLKILNGKIYWTEYLEGDLFVYDPKTKKKETLTTGINSILSQWGDNLIILKGKKKGDELYFTNAEKPYKFNLITKTFENIGTMETIGKVHYPYSCFNSGFDISKYNLETRENTIVSIDNNHSYPYPPYINQCMEDFLLYSLTPPKGNYESSIEFYKYDSKTKKNILIKQLTFSSGFFNYSDAQIINNNFYYLSPDGNLYSKNLSTSNEIVLASGGIRSWYIDNDYLIHTQGNPLYLKKIK